MCKKMLFMIVVMVWIAEVQAVEIQATYQVDSNINSVSPIYYNPAVNPGYVASPLNTGLYIEPGDRLEITAEGSWGNASYLQFGPEGSPYENIAQGYPGAGLPVASLIAKIGGNWFYVGSSFSGWIADVGYMELGFNDTDYGNNWGTVTMDIKASGNVVQGKNLAEENRLLSDEVNSLRIALEQCESIETDLEGLIEFVMTPPGVRKKVDFQPKSDMRRCYRQSDISMDGNECELVFAFEKKT